MSFEGRTLERIESERASLQALTKNSFLEYVVRVIFDYSYDPFAFFWDFSQVREGRQDTEIFYDNFCCGKMQSSIQLADEYRNDLIRAIVWFENDADCSIKIDQDHPDEHLFFVGLNCAIVMLWDQLDSEGLIEWFDEREVGLVT